jgi:hypothetical protein
MPIFGWIMLDQLLWLGYNRWIQWMLIRSMLLLPQRASWYHIQITAVELKMAGPQILRKDFSRYIFNVDNDPVIDEYNKH